MKIPVKIEDLTKEWFQQLLDETKEGVTVDDVSTEAATKAGDNFATEAVRAYVKGSKDGQPWEKSYFIKLMPVAQWMRDMIGKSKIFNQEVEAYTKILPDMKILQEGKGILPHTPKCIFADVNSNNDGIIVLEDLRPLDYKMASIRDGQDLHHCRLVMDNLAKFHALGYKCKYTTEEPVVDKYVNLRHFFFEETKEEIMAKVFENCYRVIEGILKDDVPKDAEMKKTLLEKKEQIHHKSMHNVPSEPLSTICHGDTWNNNMLFKYNEEGNPTSVVILDLQIMYYGLPTRDLGYFFCMSTTRELRKKHLKELLQYYHQQLFKYLDLLGVTQLTKEDFSFDMLWEMYYKETIYTGFVQAVSGLAYLLLPAEDIIAPKDMQGENAEEAMKNFETEILRKVMNNTKGISRVRDVIEEVLDAEAF